VSALFDLPPVAPPGFRYRAELVTPDEERELAARLATLAFEPFQFRGYEGRRRVISFGLKYDFNGPGLVTVDPLPDWLLPIRDRAAAFAVFEKVVGVSLLGATVMRFRRRAGTRFERINVPVEPRSAYLLDGPARTEWEHSLPEARAHRYSITFRNLRP